MIGASSHPLVLDSTSSVQDWLGLLATGWVVAIIPAMVEGTAPRSTGTIDGVKVVPLRRIPDERGTIYHMLRRTDEHFVEFGEIYFTTIYRDVIKGWHRHRLMTLNYACIHGRIKLVLYDDRADSPTRGTVMERFL